MGHAFEPRYQHVQIVRHTGNLVEIEISVVGHIVLHGFCYGADPVGRRPEQIVEATTKLGGPNVRMGSIQCGFAAGGEARVTGKRARNEMIRRGVCSQKTRRTKDITLYFVAQRSSQIGPLTIHDAGADGSGCMIRLGNISNDTPGLCPPNHGHLYHFLQKIQNLGGKPHVVQDDDPKITTMKCDIFRSSRAGKGQSDRKLQQVRRDGF